MHVCNVYVYKERKREWIFIWWSVLSFSEYNEWKWCARAGKKVVCFTKCFQTQSGCMKFGVFLILAQPFRIREFLHSTLPFVASVESHNKKKSMYLSLSKTYNLTRSARQIKTVKYETHTKQYKTMIRDIFIKITPAWTFIRCCFVCACVWCLFTFLSYTLRWALFGIREHNWRWHIKMISVHESFILSCSHFILWDMAFIWFRLTMLSIDMQIQHTKIHVRIQFLLKSKHNKFLLQNWNGKKIRRFHEMKLEWLHGKHLVCVCVLLIFLGHGNSTTFRFFFCTNKQKPTQSSMVLTLFDPQPFARTKIFQFNSQLHFYMNFTKINLRCKSCFS